MNSIFKLLFFAISTYSSLHASYCTQVIEAHNEWIDGMCLTHDSTMIITAARDSTIKTWDVQTGRGYQTMFGHSDWIHAVCTTMNDRTAYSASDSCIKIWDVYSGACLGTLTQQSGPIYSLCTSPNNKYLYSGNAHGIIVEWNIPEGSISRKFKGHISSIRSLDITPDSNYLVSASNDRQLKVWDITKGECVATLGDEILAAMVATRISHDGTKVYCGTYGGDIGVYDLKSYKLLARKETNLISINAICLTPDDRILITGSNNQTVDLWDAATLKHIATLTGHTHWVRNVSVTDDGKKIISCAFDGTIRIWNITGICWFWFYLISLFGL